MHTPEFDEGRRQMEFSFQEKKGRRRAGGGQKAGDTDGAGLYRHTMGLPSLALLYMCPP